MTRIADYHARVLVSAIKYPKTVLSKVCYSLTDDDFPSEKVEYFRAISRCLSDGKVTTSQLIDEINRSGLDYSILSSASTIPYTIDNIDDPIEIIQDRSNLRKIKLIAEQMVTDSSRNDNKAESLIIHGISSLSEIKTKDIQQTTAQQVDSLVENFKKFEGKELFGLSTKMKYVDNITRGMQKSHLWLMGGYTSVGKSWFAIKLFSEWALNMHQSLYISLEQSAETILTRMACTECNITDYAIKTGRVTEEKRREFYGVVDLYKQVPMSICDGLITWEEVKYRILQAIYADKVECVVIDYLQNITVKGQTEYEGLNTVVRELQRMAVKHNVFILALSQVNRASQASGDEKVFGFKGSGNIENAADVAIILRKPDALVDHVVFDVAKDRNGLIGKNLCQIDYSVGRITDRGKYEA